MSVETVKRDRVFLRFEDADYHYRSAAVEALQRKIDAAAQAKDELAEVRAYEELGALLSAGRDMEWRRRFFEDCLRPMTAVFDSGKACGHLHDLLGRLAFDMGLDDYVGYYEKAVELGNDSVIAREDVLREHPELVIGWIRGYLRNSVRDANVEEREALLARIVDSRTDASDYYLSLAEVLRDKYKTAADRYYRNCIRLGCERVANRAEFLAADYEPDYIDWFKSLVYQGVAPVDAVDRCFSRLWSSCRGVSGCSKSHQEYADSLWRSGAKRDAVAEYVRGAEAKFDWAESWLHAHSTDRMVCEGLSADLVDCWFKECEQSIDRQLSLGRYFENGGGDKYRNEQKYYVCIIRCRLQDKDVIGAVQACIQMDVAKHGCERGFMEQSALDGFSELRRDIREALRNDAAALVSREMSSKEYDSVVVEVGEWSLCPEALPYEDLKTLRDFARNGELVVSPFRTNGEKPLCCRYMLLEQMAKMFASGMGSGMEARTLEHLREVFGRLADREIEDSMAQNNPLTICRWMIHRLYETDDSSERRAGEAVLFRFVAKWQRGDDVLPIKLLAAYWNSIGRDPAYMLALRIFLDNDTKLREWIHVSNANDLFVLAVEAVAGAARP